MRIICARQAIRLPFRRLSQRRWGYYTLPILYGDDLVARLDPKLERDSMTLEIKGFWFEDDAPANDPTFCAALAQGLIRFANFLQAKQINITVIRPLKLRRELRAIISQSLDVI